MKPDSLAGQATQIPWHGLDLGPRALLTAALALLLAWLASYLVRRALMRSAARRLIHPSVGYSLTRITQIVSFVVGVLVALSTVGVGLGSLTLVAGALGIGIGFGLQSIAANFVSGLVLLFERPIRVGDRVSVGTVETDAISAINGYVKAIQLRATTVVTPDNITLIVPNVEFVTKTVVNWSLGELRMRIRLAVGVAYASDLEKVHSIMMEACLNHPGTLKDPPPEIRMIDTASSALEFQVLVWIPDPRERGRVESALRWDIVRRFREEGVTIPFPQREVRILGGELSASDGAERGRPKPGRESDRGDADG